VSSATSRSKRDLLLAGGRGAGDDAEAVTTVDTAIAAAQGGGSKTPARALGRYRLLERLGSGGFGEVFRAQDELLRREVAVKRIPCEQEGLSERAAREAHAAARLSHPAIVALYEAAQEDGYFYLTSELVQGQTLARLVASDALTDDEMLRIGIVLCDALQHAHRRGVIHRDVKPQNILVPDEPSDRGGVAKLTDFGGARLDGEEALTATGDVLGTLAYMAPEQSEGDEAGPQADLYSLALVLYEALCGENPVRAATPAATVRRIGSDLPSLRGQRHDLPRALSEAIDRALAPDPEDRGELAELADALREGLDEISGQGSRRALRSSRAPADRGRPLMLEERHDPISAAWTSISPQLRDHSPESVGATPPARIEAAPPAASVRRGQARERPRLPSLPRLIWFIAAIALLAWQAASGRVGLALVLLAGVLPLLIAMPRRASLGWLGPALAPLLGLIGIATAFPALASVPERARMRAWLGALGYWWLCLAQIGFGRGLAPATGFSTGLGSATAAGVWAAPGWEGSLTSAAHAIGSLLSPATLAGAALWGLGAAVAPWIARGRGVAFELPLAGIWSAALLAGPGVLTQALQANSSIPSLPAGAILGAVLGALLLVASPLSMRSVDLGDAAEPPHP
jgi:eukaryotic-like serine/threonine-protein kinase